MPNTIIQFEGESITPEKLPVPCGWRILIGLIKIENESDGGILLLDESVEKQEYLRCVGKVLAMGSECYKHPKFQGGIDISKRQPEQWCKVGDIVIVGQHAGQVINALDGEDVQKLKLLNDDEVLSVVPDLNHILT